MVVATLVGVVGEALSDLGSNAEGEELDEEGDAAWAGPRR